MTGMLEKMARAMQRSPAWPAVYGAGTAETLSRAALQAIREPGQAAIERGSEVGPPIHGGEFNPIEAANIWTAMIDAILAEGEGK